MVRCIWFFGNLFDDSSGSFHYCDHPYSGAVLPVQRSYINARERLRLRWTKQIKSNQIKKKQKPTKGEMLIDGQKSAYILWTRSWFLTRIHRAMRTVWRSRICAKPQRERHSATKKKREKRKKKKKEDSGTGNFSKEAVVSSWVHAALCALREHFYECLFV